MAKQILRDCYIEVNSIDFSSHVSSVEISIAKDDVDTSNFGGGREKKAGLMEASIECDFQQDFSAASVDATLYPLWDDETEFTVTIRPSATPVSATNPEYTATCILLEYQPLAGGVGDLSEISVTFEVQRDTFARAVA